MSFLAASFDSDRSSPSLPFADIENELSMKMLIMVSFALLVSFDGLIKGWEKAKTKKATAIVLQIRIRRF